MTSADIQRTLVRHYDPRKNLIVPNCKSRLEWEADVLVARDSGWAEELEIKVSVADFRREFQTKALKHRQLVSGIAKARVIRRADWVPFDAGNPLHVPISFAPGAPDRCVYFYDYSDPKPHIVRRFSYVMPEELADKLIGEIPEYAGLIAIRLDGWNRYIPIVKKAAPGLKNSRKITDEERRILLRCVYYRFWDLKRAQEQKEKQL